MGRQRTINDAEFWRSPRIADRTQEDKATLFYLLTSPYSNIIGIYAIVLRIAAAEMGWTAEQLLSVLRRLESVDLVRFDESSGFIWVKIWWDHNSAKMAVATTLRMKTYAQIDEIPISWRVEFLQDFLVRLPVADLETSDSKTSYRDLVATDLAYRGYEVPIPYRQAKDRAAANTTDNVNSINYHVDIPLEFPVLEKSVQKQLAKIITRLPHEMRQDVLDEITAKVGSGSVRSPIRLAQHFVDNPTTFVISEGLAVRHARAKRSSTQRSLHRQAQDRDIELARTNDQLYNMDDEEFENAYGRLPPNVLQRIRAYRAALRSGTPAEDIDQ